MSQKKDNKKENKEAEKETPEIEEKVEDKKEEKETEKKVEDKEEKVDEESKTKEEEIEEEKITQEDLEAEIKEDKTAKEEPKKEKDEKFPEFRVGDTIRIKYKIIEADKTRIQPFEGIVISIKGKGRSKTFTMRRIGADGVGVERIIPLHSPNITDIEIKRRGKVRKSKLYYLRDKKGRAAVRVKDREEKPKS